MGMRRGREGIDVCPNFLDGDGPSAACKSLLNWNKAPIEERKEREQMFAHKCI
jgi:hypothetical protein